MIAVNSTFVFNLLTKKCFIHMQTENTWQIIWLTCYDYSKNKQRKLMHDTVVYCEKSIFKRSVIVKPILQTVRDCFM